MGKKGSVHTRQEEVQKRQEEMAKLKAGEAKARQERIEKGQEELASKKAKEAKASEAERKKRQADQEKAAEKARLEAEAARIAQAKAIEEQKALLAEKRRENELLAAEIARQKAELEKVQQVLATSSLDAFSDSLQESVSSKEKSSGLNDDAAKTVYIAEKKIDKTKATCEPKDIPQAFDLRFSKLDFSSFEFPVKFKLRKAIGTKPNTEEGVVHKLAKKETMMKKKKGPNNS